MRRIIYLISGPRHIPYLVCSLHTLRRHWDGLVDVYAWPESENIVRRIEKDQSLRIYGISREPAFRCRGNSDTYLDKTALIQGIRLKSDAVLFLDADTTIHGDLAPLFREIEECGSVWTQFNDWTSNGPRINRRIRDLLKFPVIPRELVEEVATNCYLSINTGIFGARPDSPVLPVWHEWTKAATSVFIPDEKTAHVLMAKFLTGDRGSTEMSVACGGIWNCSPLYQPASLPDDQIMIRHYHGHSCCRPKKSQKGWELWGPIYRKCLAENVGGMAEWRAEVNNKHLDAVERQEATCG